MKLSDPGEQSVQSAFGLSSAVYTAISFYMPFSVLICALLLIERFISKWLSAFAMPYPPIAIFQFF
jgi:hypothetical protein